VLGNGVFFVLGWNRSEANWKMSPCGVAVLQVQVASVRNVEGKLISICSRYPTSRSASCRSSNSNLEMSSPSLPSIAFEIPTYLAPQAATAA
jgi:hypothetical protein